MRKLYILDAQGEPVLAPSIDHWRRFMADDHARRVAWTDVDAWSVSTVFLGADHSFGQGPPILWETMVFGPEPWADAQWRYASRDAALAQHDQIVEHVRRGGSPEDLEERE